MALTNESIRAAIHSVAAHSSYTNALPVWREFDDVEYGTLVPVVQTAAERRLRGERPTAFRIQLPRNSGKRQNWVLPALVDQVLLQAALLAGARQIDAATDRARVFSFRLREDLGTGLVDDQADAWRRFDQARRARAACERCVLQIDLEEAFARVDRERLRQFLRSRLPADEASLIDVVLAGIVGPDAGLPLVNDATFFLGSAYLSVVDAIVARYAPNFVRYMDDYKIFGTAEADLERVHEAISADLRKIGFALNAKKTWLGTTEDYVDFLDKARPAPRRDGYLTPAPSNVLDADVLVAQIQLTLTEPDRYLTDGVGRMQMASLRRLRGGTAVAMKAAHARFVTALSGHQAVLGTALDRLAAYRSAGEDWRSVWILYLLRDAQIDSMAAPLRDRFRTALRTAAEGSNPLVRLWARTPPATPPGVDWSTLFTLDYLAAGRLALGGVQ